MIAGLILSEDLEEDCSIAFLDEELETMKLKTNQEIVDAVKDKNPTTLAVDAGSEQSQQEFTKQEKELKEQGYIFTPNSHQKKKVERMQSLDRHLEHATQGQTEIIRFDPQITANKLAIDSDKDLASLGVKGEIGSVEEFNAVLGAITARFYTQNQFEDLGVVVPKNIGKS